MTYAIMLGVFVILLFLGAPIALSLGMSSLLAILYNGTGINVIAGQIYGGIGKYLLLAVPFFVLSGNIMAKAGISDRLIAFIDALLGHLRGGIAMVCVVVACFFGAISGSGAATVAALGVILIPAMIEREKFSDPFAHGVVAAASSIAVIIPPSISFVIYASLTGVSVGDIFVAGILPGVIMGVAMIIVVQIYAHKHHLKPAHPWKGWREVWRTFKSAFWGLLMPVIILDGIYSDLFTPTEAAAIAVFYGIIVSAFVYRNMGMKDFLHVLSASASSTASILFLVANAHIFSYLLSSEQIPQKLAILMTSLTTDPTMIMADEPTGALDSKSARLLLESLEALNRRLRATVLMVTHDSFAASYTSRVLFIRDGKIFTELRRGDTDRREFFDRIMEVVAMMGGEGSDAL